VHRRVCRSRTRTACVPPRTGRSDSRPGVKCRTHPRNRLPPLNAPLRAALAPVLVVPVPCPHRADAIAVKG
jgi:hypothetical protein